MNLSFLKINFFVLLQLSFFVLFAFQIEASYFSTKRFYDPKMGRFSKADTVVPKPDLKGLNRYAYTYNNPLRYSDPDGHSPEDEKGGTLEFIGRSIRAGWRFWNSNRDQSDKNVFESESLSIFQDYQKHISNKFRSHETDVFVTDNPNIPNTGQRVADALQELAGDLAIIEIQPTEYNLKPGETATQLTYRLTSRGLDPNNNSPWKRSWTQLRGSLDATQNARRPKSAWLKVTDGPSQDSATRHGRTTDRITHFLVELHIQPDHLQVPLSILAAHELKHVEDKLGGNTWTGHFSTAMHYLFYDDVAYLYDIAYREAYNRGVSEGKRIPVIPPAYGNNSPTFVPYGYGARKIYQFMGIDPTKMAESDEENR